MSSAVPEIDPLGFGLELQEQIASANRSIGVLFGAGSSISSGLPDLAKLTDDVSKILTGENQGRFNDLRRDGGNIETVLNTIRALREILADKDSFRGLTERHAKDLDAAICQAIYERVAASEPKPSRAHISFAQWVQLSRHIHPVEVFTTNYDLLFEAAFESVGLPYFDGFVGAFRPFFVPQSVDPLSTLDAQLNVPPATWVRLWKLHGSVGWRFVTDAVSQQKKIIRVTGPKPNPGEEVVIYPSREKYSESRRLPYLTYIDRLRRFLGDGERVFLTCGYSFGDEHINEVLRQGLQSNTRLAIHAFFFEAIPDSAKLMASYHPNMTALGRREVVLGAKAGKWSAPTRKLGPGEQWHFWDVAKSEFILGDFGALGAFLGGMTGRQPPQSATTP